MNSHFLVILVSETANHTQLSMFVSTLVTNNLNKANFFSGNNQSCREGKIHCGHTAAIFISFCHDGKKTSEGKCEELI